MPHIVGEIACHDHRFGFPHHDVPFTFGIANGQAFGFTAYSLRKILRGKFREVT